MCYSSFLKRNSLKRAENQKKKAAEKEEVAEQEDDFIEGNSEEACEPEPMQEIPCDIYAHSGMCRKCQTEGVNH